VLQIKYSLNWNSCPPFCQGISAHATSASKKNLDKNVAIAQFFVPKHGLFIQVSKRVDADKKYIFTLLRIKKCIVEMIHVVKKYHSRIRPSCLFEKSS